MLDLFTVSIFSAEVDVIMDTSLTLTYPPHTPGYESLHGTYYHNLSPASLHALETLQAFIVENHINLSDLALYSLHPHLTLLRYLRANNFDIKKTTTHITKNIRWRNDMKVDEIVSKKPEELLGFTMEQLTTVFPHW